MLKKRSRVLCGLAALLLLCTACTGTGEETPGTQVSPGAQTEAAALTLTLPYYPNDALNPYFAASAYNRGLSDLFCEPLFRVQADYSAKPVLAASAENRGTSLFVTLGSGRFPDGSAVTAADVVYSFTCAKASGWYASRLANLSAASAESGGVTFTLASPDRYAQNLLTFPIVKSGTADAADSIPAGTGPYVLAADGTLTANPARDGAAAAVTLQAVQDEAHLTNALEIGNISYLFDDFADGTYTRPAGQAAFVTMNSLVYLGINGTGVLQSAGVRTALYYAIDADSLAASAYRGCAESAALPFHPAFCRANGFASGHKADTALAADILSRLGFNRFDANGVRTNGTASLALTLLVNSENNFRTAAAYAIAAALNEAGFSVTVESVPRDEYLSRIAAGDFTLYLGEVKLGENLSLSPFFTASGAASRGIDQTLPVVAAYTAFCAGETDAAAFSEAFLDDMPFVPLCYRAGLAAYSARIQPDFSTAAYSLYGDITLWRAAEAAK